MKFAKTRLILVLLATASSGISPLCAQTNAAPSANAAPPHAPEAKAAPAPAPDPFVKKNAPDPAAATGPQANLVFTYEFYQLPQAEGAKLLQGESSDQERYTQLRDLVKQGKAKLDALMGGAQAEGEQLSIAQADIFKYPIACASANTASGAKTIIGADFKRRNLGYRLVIKAQTVPGNKECDISMFPEHTRLQGFIDRTSWMGTNPFTLSQPVFATQRLNTKPPLLPFDEVHLLGTFNPSSADLPQPGKTAEPAKEAEMGLIFARVSRVVYDPGQGSASKLTGVNLVVSVYSMERDEALHILTQPQRSGFAYSAVEALVKSGQAKLEQLTAMGTRNGLKCNSNQVLEDIIPTGGQDQWESQDVGFSVEAMPQLLGGGNAVSLDVTQCQFLRDIGPLPGPGAFAEMVASQPIFRVQSVVTRINAAVGEHALLGTISPPGDTGLPGAKDDGRVWLAFVQATTVNP